MLTISVEYIEFYVEQTKENCIETKKKTLEKMALKYSGSNYMAINICNICIQRRLFTIKAMRH